MGNRVVIAGAGGFGRGVYSWMTASPEYLRQHDVAEIVFIDDGVPQKEPQGRVVATIQNYRPRPADLVVCAIGVPAIRRKVVQTLTRFGAQFHTFVDDRAILGSGVVLGIGAIVCPGVVMGADAVLGDHVHVNFNCSIGHDTKIGELSTLSPSVNIMGEVVVGEQVFFGGSAVVLPRLAVANRVTVGAGAVVHRSVAEGATMVGNPARRLVKT